MSNLKAVDRQYLERLLNMGSGYVLNFSDASFEEFFKQFNIDIHGGKYNCYGASKAKKLRSFWDQESDVTVAMIMSEMLEVYQAEREIGGLELERAIFDRLRAALARISGALIEPNKSEGSIDEFLEREFTIPNINKLPIEPQVAQVVESRLEEARRALKVDAPLSIVFLCGSVLEAVLIGTTQKEPKKFNHCNASPRDDKGNVMLFHRWSLAQFIDVASAIGLLKTDVKKFSHGLRGFRNYIHPYEQMMSGFSPNGHSAPTD